MIILEQPNDNIFSFILVYGIISKKTIKIEKFKKNNFITSFLNLIEKITVNTKYEIKENFVFYPGDIYGGKDIHDCLVYNISMYIIPLLILAPFTKKEMQITFTGITNNRQTSIDMIRLAYLKVLKDFGVENIEIKILKRGFEPEGKGEVFFRCGNVEFLNNIEKSREEKLIKIRGMVVGSKINSSIPHSLIELIKDGVTNFTENVKVYTDLRTSTSSGPSPGYQLILYAEGKKTFYFSEELGDERLCSSLVTKAIDDLIKSIKNSESYDVKVLPLVFTFLALTSHNVSEIRIRKIGEDCKIILNYLKIFFSYRYSFKREEKNKIINSFGNGYRNIYRTIK
ncbi:RNA 3'-terminal phosphate cyclase [Hamiltosporidium tvaerminnensis]|uniref:RNA 3'-terminal phosphate cyclase n=1 Tax=Hamiltosporidium tvaerminnensis TaxID=1176355 RepID=A0A4Q9M104_9MICR|nr:RNA 3'-terminal phosphate cyclase [Hamiltosporidium tvaerminnensis]